MARPTTKEQLLQYSEENFHTLFALIGSMTAEQQETPFGFEDRDKNVRDVLIHLYEWHRLLLQWIRSNQAGRKMNFLPEPYNWKTYPQMNVEFWKKHQQTSLAEAVKLLRQSHAESMELIGSFSNEQLFTNNYFSWTGSTSLGSYCVSSTSSHYDWAIKKIKKHKKSLPD
ncbi:MAG TPA: hypothetical protein DDZ96_04130 [Porphyromonadaceae bacterium]|jgi:hypothetical protein|uniref:ClbS/DfsB family four-helix bundle protein n=1 Tax=Limibacterium fermenti TaxID=3229863 RepID=UPI000E8739F3|nr:hypothetical protein [Porphyromonadaceae bacterium]HBK31928.1 hypothetical protein [Porphyromonadaceae bacterium]HBL32993.1 hypothetical protein [Porphyromonadaceae bacterium]HBX21996.1 hypothetical protein [Porphyromonadaceae bacterium]HBX44569.1 hypothetical protein [Porphyromonadaceae bacterium]